MPCVVTARVAEGNCVAEAEWFRVAETGWRAAGVRTSSLQDDEPVSAGRSGEPAELWRSLEPQGTDCVHGGDKARDTQARNVFGGWMLGRQNRWTGEACCTGEVRQDSEPS